MKKITVLVAPAGAGKSTYCEGMFSDINARDSDESLVRISQDEQGKDGHMKLFKASISAGNNIVIDRMGFSKEQRERYLKPAREAGYTTEIVVLHVPRQICFDRMMLRENHPTINGKKAWDVMKGKTYGEETKKYLEATELEWKEKEANSALDTFFTKYERVEDSEADKVTRLGWDVSRPSTVICDLDGTLCDITHRLKHVKHEIKKHNRWDLFNKEIPNDKLNIWCANLIQRMNVYDCFAGQLNSIVLCSGRVDSSRQDTEEWLEKHNIEYHNLFMRHRSDFRQDYIIKEIILDFEILPRYNVLFAIDDRQQVVDMWRRRGIVCLQCDVGDF